VTQLLLVAECCLPGCRRTAEQPGGPCGECVGLFDGSLGGWRIQEAAGVPETAEQVAERKAETRAAQRKLEGPERKANQRCWICEERRTCVRAERGWKCRSCQEVR
jgi:hypothetical protein